MYRLFLLCATLLVYTQQYRMKFHDTFPNFPFLNPMKTLKCYLHAENSFFSNMIQFEFQSISQHSQHWSKRTAYTAKLKLIYGIDQAIRSLAIDNEGLM